MAILQSGTPVSVADETTSACDSLEGYSTDNHVSKTCKRFLKQAKYKDYTPYSIIDAEDIADTINHILENSAHKKFVFFLAKQTNISSTIKIKDVDLALVGILSDQAPFPEIILKEAPSLDKPLGPLIHFESSGRELLLNNIILNDANYHNWVDSKTFPYISTANIGVINIESAKNVTLDHVGVVSSFHKQVVNLNCNNKLSIASSTQVKIVNSILSITGPNARGIEFNCDNKLHTFNNQVAFNKFMMEPPLPDTKIALPSSPEADIGIFIDIEGKINFSESACNSLQYTNEINAPDRSVPSRQTLFKSGTGEFTGVLATMKTNSLNGTFFAPQEAAFKHQNYCMPLLTAHSQTMIHKYLPTFEEVRSVLNNKPLAADSNTSGHYWKNKYHGADKLLKGLIAVASIEGAVITGMIILLYKYRIRALSENPSLLRDQD